ncbi:MAG: hypothetical protein EXQ47_05330 [Bryobacterales bacterium]|nr:hypothetical protein [Bryobacterales bacterium]
MRRPAAVAAVAVCAAAAWLVLCVVYLYAGNPTGLFYTGLNSRLPADLDAGHTRRVNDPIGYDGAFYHLIAHDPLNRRGVLDYADTPSLRWRRIGVPALAALIGGAAGGRWVDYSYIGVELVFLALGVYWLARYAQVRGCAPIWGLGFFLIPAVAVSLDRMTIDLPLAALCIGLALRAESSKTTWPAYVMLIAAPLIRDTGIILVAAWCLYSALQRDWRSLLLGVLSAMPALAWWAYVRAHTPADGNVYLARYPFGGILGQTLSGYTDPTHTLWLRAAYLLEWVALAGIWLALGLALYFGFTALRSRHARWMELTAVLFAVFAASLNQLDLWASAYATGRTMSPMLIMLALLAWEWRRPMFALPLLLVAPRIALQYEAQLLGVLRGVGVLRGM